MVALLEVALLEEALLEEALLEVALLEVTLLEVTLLSAVQLSEVLKLAALPSMAAATTTVVLRKALADLALEAVIELSVGGEYVFPVVLRLVSARLFASAVERS